jgi:hypothetical protein
MSALRQERPHGMGATQIGYSAFRVAPAAFQCIDQFIFIASVWRAGLLPSSKEHAIVNFAMTIEVNQGVVGDTAKLIMHRLIARQIRRDPALVEKAKIAHARQADQFAGWPFVREWDELLSLPPDELTSKLISRDREMVRLRNSSPFYLCEGVDFGDYKMRIRIRRAARRIAERALASHPTPRRP